MNLWNKLLHLRITRAVLDSSSWDREKSNLNEVSDY